MRNVLHLLRNHRRSTPATNETVMDRACEVLENYRGVVIELLSMLSWLRNKQLLPEDLDFEKVERVARELIDIEEVVIDHQAVDIMGKNDTQLVMPLAEPPTLAHPAPPSPPEAQRVPGAYDMMVMPGYKICPRCGDRTPKIVHLRQRPKPGLECAACHYEYPFPHRWGPF